MTLTLRRNYLALLIVSLLSSCTHCGGGGGSASSGQTENPSSASSTSAAQSKIVDLQTTVGKISLELDAAHAPKSVANFLAYVDSGFYDGTIFHRVIDGFVIQGGGFDTKMSEKPTHDPIQNEASNGLSNSTLTVAMARTLNPNSATSQFYINLKDNPDLDYKAGESDGYAVFGKVIEGADIVRKIASMPTETVGAYQNFPKEPVAITKASVRKP